jgi:hypothetical protein
MFGSAHPVNGHQRMKRKIAFVVQEAGTDEQCSWVTGRNCEDLIRVGDVFESFCMQTFPNAEKHDFQTRIRSEEQPVQLRITAIHVFRHSLQELSPGMGAKLEVKGSGLELIKQEAVLMGNAVP